MATMEERMTRVEQEVRSINATLEHLATKSDLAELKAELIAELTWRMFGMVIALMVGVASVVAAVQTILD
ncbi:MAG: hypothetical protein F4X40_00570 [Chloroflexi bacterium]|nr:hypothetical protein [Chloroflexota bacterium]